MIKWLMTRVFLAFKAMMLSDDPADLPALNDPEQFRSKSLDGERNAKNSGPVGGLGSPLLVSAVLA